jgi:hypothetical protein
MRHNRIGGIVAIGAIVALVTACGTSARSAPSGGSDPTSSDGGLGSASSHSGPGTTSSRSGSGSGSPGGGSGTEPSDGGFAWVPFGPADPTSPIPGDWPQYNMLAQHHCGDLMQSENGATSDQLWAALNALCAAVVAGDRAQWNVARTAFGNASGQHFSNQCLENAARALLKRALAWHNAYPNSRPAVHFPVAATETDCGKRANQTGAQPSEPTDSSPSSQSSESSQPSKPSVPASPAR